MTMAIEPATLLTGPAVIYTIEGTLGAGGSPHCRVFWGSHGCMHPRGHDPGIPHECDCCECPEDRHPDPDADALCVAKPPYYGQQTRFYGEDAGAYGLPVVGSG